MIQEIPVVSTIDGSREPNLLHVPRTQQPVPLVIGLHTWSYDRFNQAEAMLPFCQVRGWALLLPEFRGPNLVTNPSVQQACASPLAKQDVIDALDYVIDRHPINPGLVFLLGASGGGQMALMLAAYAPARWQAVSAWVPITDLTDWHDQNREYSAHIEACCGGSPGINATIDQEYRERSPIYHVDRMHNVNLAVHHGRHDAVVPFSHSWNFALALERHNPGRFYFEIFDGGHEIRYEDAFRWFDTLVDAEDELDATTRLTR